MIASLRGIVQYVATDHVVVELGGLGFQVYVPRPLLHNAPLGHEIQLATHLVVREDALTLYGFATPAEQALFGKLIAVTGVGPRLALALLSSASPDEVQAAVLQQNTARFVQVPGIGKKMAERLVLELKGKLDTKGLAPAAAPASTTPTALAINTELGELLVSLGYSSAEANEAIAALPADAPADLEERLRLALRHFGGA